MAAERRRVRPWLILLGGVVIAAGAGWLAGRQLDQLSARQPRFDAVRDEWRSADVRILDREGQLLARVRTDYTARRGDWVPLAQMSPALLAALRRSEDRRFDHHAGVDWRAAAGAAWRWLRGGQAGGASTLTMQLAGLLDPALRQRSGGRSLRQKAQQVWAALALERHWDKAQILEAYLNLASFRGELVGVDALSTVLMQKRPVGLDAAESSLAVALLRAPNASADAVARRACRLLRAAPELAQAATASDCRELAPLARRSLARASQARYDHDALAPHAGRWLSQRAAAPGVALLTTLDAGVQAAALDAVARHLPAWGSARVRDAAVVVLDNRQGDVLAYVGSSGALSEAPAVDHARAWRQAGSTLKPFLYAQALAEGRLTMASLLHDAPLSLSAGAGLYAPQNYDGQYAGWVSARTALAASLNIPAVRVVRMVTPQALTTVLRQAGLDLTQDADHYGDSLALGSADVTLLNLTNAYRTLANGGRHGALRWLARDAAEPPADAVWPPQAAWIIGDVLADRHARARTFGVDSVLATPFWSAVKTGTSKDMRDNWTLGWSSRYTVGVWVGNSAGASMRDVSGVTGAGPIWHDVMRYLHRDGGGAPPAMPPSLESTDVRFEPPFEPARREVFMPGTALAVVQWAGASAQAGAARIASPVRGTILALDPDIPVRWQRLWLRATDAVARPLTTARWLVNGVPVPADARGEAGWTPYPGRHRVELLDDRGVRLDVVDLDVRGAAGERPSPL